MASARTRIDPLRVEVRGQRHPGRAAGAVLAELAAPILPRQHLLSRAADDRLGEERQRLELSGSEIRGIEALLRETPVRSKDSAPPRSAGSVPRRSDCRARSVSSGSHCVLRSSLRIRSRRRPSLRSHSGWNTRRDSALINGIGSIPRVAARVPASHRAQSARKPPLRPSSAAGSSSSSASGRWYAAAPARGSRRERGREPRLAPVRAPRTAIPGVSAAS